jgi:hypothetical protein
MKQAQTVPLPFPPFRFGIFFLRRHAWFDWKIVSVTALEYDLARTVEQSVTGGTTAIIFVIEGYWHGLCDLCKAIGLTVKFHYLLS